MIWLDLDDTIWDMTGNAKITLRRLYREQNLDRYFPTPDNWVDLYETINHSLWNLYNHGRISEERLRTERFAAPLRLAGLKSAEAETFAATLDVEYLDNLGKCTNLIPGARECLDRLVAEGRPLGILSNGFRDVQRNKLINSGLEKYFDVVVLSGEAGVAKPNPEIFRFAARKANVDQKDCVMVGDSLVTDIAGACNAGWPSVWYRANRKDIISSDKENLPPSTVVIDAISSLPEALNSL